MYLFFGCKECSCFLFVQHFSFFVLFFQKMMTEICQSAGKRLSVALWWWFSWVAVVFSIWCKFGKTICGIVYKVKLLNLLTACAFCVSCRAPWARASSCCRRLQTTCQWATLPIKRLNIQSTCWTKLKSNTFYFLFRLKWQISWAPLMQQSFSSFIMLPLWLSR